jgi:DNA-binding NtrC family response regulator
VCEILLVDDDPDFSTSLAELLEEEGLSVTCFETPDEAFEWLLVTAAERPAVVLLDLRTPGISAQRFRALLMSKARLSGLPVVVVSGDPHIQFMASAVGASEAFEKPVDFDRLLATIKRHCEAQVS